MAIDYGWRLDRDAWECLQAVLAELNWFDLPFERLNAPSVPEQSGVYIICGRPPIIMGRLCEVFFSVIYVGKSETSIRSRFIVHCDNPDEGIKRAKRCYAHSVTRLRYYYAVAPQEKVAEVESRLIECFGLSANRQSGIILAKVRTPGMPAG